VAERRTALPPALIGSASTGENPALLATELIDLIERLDAMEEDAREVIAESRRLTAANRRLLAQLQTEPGRKRAEKAVSVGGLVFVALLRKNFLVQLKLADEPFNFFDTDRTAHDDRIEAHWPIPPVMAESPIPVQGGPGAISPSVNRIGSPPRSRVLL
jgi:hypothetical protein